MNTPRYNSYSGYFKKIYGQRLQKVVIDAGFSCPNRDGKISEGGCTFCNNDAFHPNYSTPDKSIIQQINEGLEFHQNRYRKAEKFLAYFQSYSNTYAPLELLKKRYEEALAHPDIVGIVIGTRPDCVDDQVLDYLQDLSQRGKIIIVEYGIESCYDKTLERVNRGHGIQQAIDAVNNTAQRGLDVGAHFIFGLPGESKQEMLDYAKIINSLPLNSVKFHQLQIIKGTQMEKEKEDKPEDFVEFALDEYIDFFIDFLETLRPDLYIERFAGEVPPRFVNESPWGMIRNVQLLQKLEKRLVQRDTYQGARYRKG